MEACGGLLRRRVVPAGFRRMALMDRLDGCHCHEGGPSAGSPYAIAARRKAVWMDATMLAGAALSLTGFRP